MIILCISTGMRSMLLLLRWGNDGAAAAMMVPIAKAAGARHKFQVTQGLWWGSRRLVARNNAEGWRVISHELSQLENQKK